MGLYVPMVNQDLWTKLGPKLQETMLKLWSDNLPAWRDNTAKCAGARPRGPDPAGRHVRGRAAGRARRGARQDACKSRTRQSPTRIFRRSWSSWSWRMSASEHAQLAAPRLSQRFFAAWDRVERTLVGLLGGVALAIAVVQVFGRYIDPSDAITWAEEVIVYIMVWAIMIIASQLVRTDGQVRPDLVLRMLPPGVQRWVEMFNCLVAIAFTFGMVWYGWARREHRGDARPAQLLRPAIPDLDLLHRAAGRRRADAGALSDPAGALRFLLRPAHDVGRPHAGRSRTRWGPSSP